MMKRGIEIEFIIGSVNQAKVKAAENVISTYYPEANLTAMNTHSNVSAQPISDEETMRGAINRAINVQSENPNAIGIGLEGGVKKIGNTFYICNWGALILRDGQILTAGGAEIPLPDEIAKEIEIGKELGPVIEQYFKQKGVRQKEGAMGMLTAGAVTRIELFTHILQLLFGQLRYYLKIKER